jgi:integrase
MRTIELVAEYAALAYIGERTVRLHRIAVRHFSLTLLRHAEVEDFTDANVARHVARRLQLVEAATVAGEQCKLLALWRFAARQGYLEKWPTLRPVKVPDRVPRAWTKDELPRVFGMFKHARDNPNRWLALFSVLWDTGERIEAVLLLQWPQIDLAGLSVLMHAETRKGGRRDRLYPITPQTAAALDALPREYPPFDFHCCHGTIYNRLRRMMVKAGLPTDRSSKFHRMRRSVASHYEAAGGNATELLDHSSRKVTRLYLDPRIVRPPAAIDLLFRPNPPTEP